MQPFSSLIAIAAPLLRENIDTDAIIPSREMTSVSKTGLADGLFAGWRYLGTAIRGRDPDPAFVLNQAAYTRTQILLVGANFGCGSSREHAAWALAEYGIRAIVAPSFNPIFRGNCVRTGILPAVLEAPVIAALAEAVAPDPRSRQIRIDLAAQTVTGPDGAPHTFEIAEEAKQMLLHALDAIDLTLELGPDIDAFIACDRVARGWVYPTV